jgi:hypothetical protein
MLLRDQGVSRMFAPHGASHNTCGEVVGIRDAVDLDRAGGVTFVIYDVVVVFIELKVRISNRVLELGISVKCPINTLFVIANEPDSAGQFTLGSFDSTPESVLEVVVGVDILLVGSANSSSCSFVVASQAREVTSVPTINNNIRTHFMY